MRYNILAQWRRQTQEVGGAKVRGSGDPSAVQGQSSGGGLGAKPPEADPYTRFIVAKSRYFHYNLRGLEVFRVS